MTFAAIYTAQDVGSYKPNPANFTYMLEHLKADLGLTAGDVLHTAQSLFHDHVQASRAGLARAWIDRQGLADGDHWGATAVVPEPRNGSSTRSPGCVKRLMNQDGSADGNAAL